MPSDERDEHGYEQGSGLAGGKVRDERTAVDKALALLGAFGQESTTGLGVTELARRSSLGKSTAFRVLAMLEKNHAVERAGTQYRLGPLLHEITSPVVDHQTDMVRDTLTPFLANLYERTRQTVHLAVLDGTDVIYLNKLHGLQQVPAPSRIGGRIPAHCTAVGKALLAHDAEALERVLAGPLVAWTPNSITDPAVLRAQVEQVRAEGVAYDREEIMLGLTCVAGIVLSPTGQAVGSMSVSGPTGRYEPASRAPAVRAVCGEASKAYAARRRSERRR